jgi:hypothetical protein
VMQPPRSKIENDGSYYELSLKNQTSLRVIDGADRNIASLCSLVQNKTVIQHDAGKHCCLVPMRHQHASERCLDGAIRVFQGQG